MNEEPVVLHQRSSRTIVKPIINQETNKYEYTPEVKKESKDEIIYQPVKLIKETESRTDESNHTVKALKRARSLEFLAPDTRFNSILEDLRFVPGQPSKCDFLIEVSMYNEGVKNFTDTLSGICDNLNDFNRVGIDPLRIACVIIVDGIRPFYSTFTKQRGFFEQFFVEDMIKERFGVGDVRNCKIMDEEEDDEFAHCFMQRITLAEFSTLELQLIFCVKQKNKRKLNTHLWFFGGFCEFINPKFVMLIDVGTAPLPRSLFLLNEACSPCAGGRIQVFPHLRQGPRKCAGLHHSPSGSLLRLPLDGTPGRSAVEGLLQKHLPPRTDERLQLQHLPRRGQGPLPGPYKQKEVKLPDQIRACLGGRN